MGEVTIRRGGEPDVSPPDYQPATHGRPRSNDDAYLRINDADMCIAAQAVACCQLSCR